MKTLTILGITIMAFTSCGVLTPQETQEERQRLLAAYDAAREKHNPERVKKAVKDLLVGKWQYVGLEVEEGSINVQRARTMPWQKPSTPTKGLAKGDTSEQATAPSAPEQAAAPAPPTPEEHEQPPAEKATRLPPVEVTDEKSNQRILGAKAALVASTRQNLTLEFSEDRSSYYYSGSNRGTNVTGQCYVTTKRYGDAPFAFIRFNRRTGPEVVEFLFGSEPVKRIAAKEKQKRTRRMNSIGGRRAAAKQAAYTIASMPAIIVTADRLYLVLYGEMELTPKGWMRTGGLRCTFKRIE